MNASLRDRLVVRRDAAAPPRDPDALCFAELADRARGGSWRGRPRAREVVLEVEDLDRVPKPLATALLVRSLARERCVVRDAQGRETRLDWRRIASIGAASTRDALAAPGLVASARRRVARLSQRLRERRAHGGPRLAAGGAPVYLRGDPVQGLRVGGSLAHAAGVINHLGELTGTPAWAFSPTPIPLLDPEVEARCFRAPTRFWDFDELQRLWCSERFAAEAETILAAAKPAFLYARYGLLGTLGPALSLSTGLPLVVEYNGSELWVRRHWGRGLRLRGAAERIERLNLDAADLVVVVSRALESELRARGVPRDRIVVSPNGVDPERFHPELSGADVRCRLGLGDDVVVGFVGTFETWHGADVLASAFEELRRTTPGARLLFVGDGPGRSAVERRLAVHVGSGHAVFAGEVEPRDVPAHLAACDVLASPQLPNPDGSEFFGSPTKLFEYMASGRAIAASRLGQVAEVLEHGRTAWLVAPGDVRDLARALAQLAGDAPLRARLGAAARCRALAHHTWRDHVRRIGDALVERCG